VKEEKEIKKKVFFSSLLIKQELNEELNFQSKLNLNVLLISMYWFSEVAEQVHMHFLQ